MTGLDGRVGRLERAEATELLGGVEANVFSGLFGRLGTRGVCKDTRRKLGRAMIVGRLGLRREEDEK